MNPRGGSARRIQVGIRIGHSRTPVCSPESRTAE